MKLSISNIGWESSDDTTVYKIMSALGFTGLEIAPTRIIPDSPYERPGEAAEFSARLKEEYGFSVPSMQSILYGRTERIFGPEEERRFLCRYTEKAIDFAAEICCRNLVFGCPKNRSIPDRISHDNASDITQDSHSLKIALDFFRRIADYAAEKNTVIGLEANPPMYNTNFINDTRSAIEFIKLVDSEGLKLNLDIGTVIANNEDITGIKGNTGLVSHVHISEPGLKPIEKRPLHIKLKNILEAEGYTGFISVEQGKTGDISVLENCMAYVREIFA